MSPQRASARLAVVKLLKMRADERAVLLVPNVCLAECSKAFATIIQAQTHSAEKAAAKYDATVETMLDFVSSSRQGSMGRELMKVHGSEHVRVVTGDRWMAEVCNRNADLLPRAIDVYKDPIPDG